MAEENANQSGTATAEGTTPKPGVITKAGGSERGEFIIPGQQTQQQNPPPKQDPPKQDPPKDNPPPGVTGTQGPVGTAGTEAPDITDEQLKKYFEKQGIKFEGNIEDLKETFEKLNAPPPPPETEEQKKQREANFEKRMHDYFIANGGKGEDFYALKQIGELDLRELSISQIRKEAKEAGLDETQTETILQERYYQLNPDGLEKIEGESEEDFKARKESYKKKNAYGTKMLQSRGESIKKSAADTLATLRGAIEAQDLQVKKEAELSSKVDAFAKKIARKVTFELGEHDGKKVDPIQYDISENDVAEVVATLKDPAKRKQYSINLDDSSNLETVAKLLLDNRILNSALKAALLEGGNRQVAEFEKMFPGRTAADVGVGGAQDKSGQPGVITKAGAPEHVGHNRQ